MIGDAVYSGRFGGANSVEKIQAANRCDQLHILNLKLGNRFLQHLDIC